MCKCCLLEWSYQFINADGQRVTVFECKYCDNKSSEVEEHV